MPSSKVDQLLRLARRGPLRARDLDAAKIPRVYLRRLTARGDLEHVGRGLYRVPNAPVTELHALAEVSKRVPHAIICLLSALQAHGLTSEAPHAVWVMIDSRARTPRLDRPTLEVVRAHGPARDHGRMTRRIEGVDVTLTTAAKTVADCFRFRRHIGLAVALAALRDYLQRVRTSRRDSAVRTAVRSHPTREALGAGARRAPFSASVDTIDALVDAARADRVYRVMRPYLEALT